jgi:hypothetical protein
VSATDSSRPPSPHLFVENCPVQLAAGDVIRALQRGQPDLWHRWAMTAEAVLFAPQTRHFPDYVVEVGVALRDRRGAVRLSWTSKHGGGAQMVDLTTTLCRITGLRWWWTCPRTGQHAVRLYLPPGRAGFASRDGHALGYRDKHLSPAARARLKAMRLREALGQKPAILGSPMPPPPARMSARIYLQATDAIAAAEGILNLGRGEHGA